MEYPPYDEIFALKPVSAPHAHKSKETLRLEYKLYNAVESFGEGDEKAEFLCMTHTFLEPEDRNFPYWSVVTIKDISSVFPTGFSYFKQIKPIPKDTRVTQTADEAYDRAAREKSIRTEPYSIKTEWIFEHMYVDPSKAELGTPRIEQAVCIVMRLTATLTTIADRLERRARKLAVHMGVAEAVDAEDTRRQGLLTEEETRPMPWIPNHYKYNYRFRYDPSTLLPRDQKPGNRIAFEERVEMAFFGHLTSEYVNRLSGIRVSSRMVQTKLKKMTPQQKEATGTIMTSDIVTALYEGDTVEAIQKSLEMARGLRASVKRLNEAICLYAEPATLALAMSQHSRLGERSVLNWLDQNTIRTIGAMCMEWFDQPITTDHRAEAPPGDAR